MSAAENYLRDVLELLIERAKEAKAQRDVARSAGDAEQASFEGGRSLAYYEVVSAVLGRLSVHGLDAKALGVRSDFNPDRELV